MNYNELMAQLDLDQRVAVKDLLAAARRVESLMSDEGRATLEATRTRWLNARRGVCGSGRSVAPDRLPDDYQRVYDPATGKSSFKYTPRPAGQDDADQSAKWAYIAQLRWEDDADARGAAEASIKLALDAREAVLRASARVE